MASDFSLLLPLPPSILSSDFLIFFSSLSPVYPGQTYTYAGRARTLIYIDTQVHPSLRDYVPSFLQTGGLTTIVTIATGTFRKDVLVSPEDGIVGSKEGGKVPSNPPPNIVLAGSVH